MLSLSLAAIAFATSILPSLSAAQDVFAHVIVRRPYVSMIVSYQTWPCSLQVGNTAAYDVAQWTSDMQLASSYGIDGFVLNIVSPFNDGSAVPQPSNAFQAANALGNFKLFFSFDYLGGGAGNPWSSSDVISILNTYGVNDAYYKVDGKPFISTFEGPSNSDINEWSSIRSGVSGGIYLVPDWTSVGPGGFSTDLVDGAFSWNMWPDGQANMSTAADEGWVDFLKPAGKSYMMGSSARGTQKCISRLTFDRRRVPMVLHRPPAIQQSLGLARRRHVVQPLAAGPRRTASIRRDRDLERFRGIPLHRPHYSSQRYPVQLREIR